ncbi:MAG: hypothetical protein IJ418_14400 [Clostridia bacterium]|nr:hypothetical protein [Clostridia bacterium]
MELKDAKCPGCGGELKLNPALEKGICIYCGKEILVAEAIQRAIVDGLQTSDAAITRAYQKLEDGDVDGARSDFLHVIDLKPTFGEAHFGVFVCALFEAEYYRRVNRGMQRNLFDYIDNLINAATTYGKRALQYAATDEERDICQRQIDLVKEQVALAKSHLEYDRLSWWQKRGATAPAALNDLLLLK